ncbi:MAG: hypothetical protein P1U56_12710 [Saprospiraceae bacterium]|nr:hypothetical protein [Saprospiraceae bacterium]
MGVSTNCKIAMYTKDKSFIKKYDLEGRADGFIYGLLNDGGATFDPSNYGEFTEHQIEIMKVYFDKESMSVSEGYASVTSNIQDPKELKKVWIKIRSSVIKSFHSELKSYRSGLLEQISEMQEEIKKSNESKSGLFSKKATIKIAEPKVKMDEHRFDRVLFDYTWSLNSISKIITGLEMAIADGNLVEITASDW